MFRVTKDWINKHKTKKGAWTKAQINALGLYWPPTKGWADDLENSYIPTENARLFEASSTQKAGSVKSKGTNFKLESAVAIVINGKNKLTAEQIERILTALANSWTKGK